MQKYILIISLVLISSTVSAQEQTSYWPKQIDLGDNLIITIYSPQPENFENNILDARAAFSIFDNEHLPVFGAMWFRARVHTEIKTNEVFFEDIKLMNANFPDATAESIEELQQMIADVVPKWHFNSNLKKFYKDIQSISIKDEYSADLKNNPPKIYYSKTPGVLVFIDGDPILGNFNGSELYQYIVNTPHFIVKSSSDKHFYLNGGGYWYTSTDPTVSSWKPVDTPPAYISQLTAGASQISQDQQNTDRPTSGPPPKLIVTQEPAELIQTVGPTQIRPVHENIFIVDNSDDVILFDSYSDYYYILISGRWYRTKNIEYGSWAFVAPEDLPEVFREIPPTSDFASIRLSVRGTPESISAALDNAIPQTAVVDRKTATMEIEFDGPPQFAAIEGTALQYGVNTNGSVILDQDSTYYAVDQAIWFSSNSINGPWKAADHYPSEVQNIPPSCPLFNVKFVYIYDYSPDFVYVGYTAGYKGAFLYNGVVFYGTGYRYKPWYGSMYIPRPSTYGHGAKKKKSGNSRVTVTVGVGYGYGYPGMGFGYPVGGWGYPYGGYGYPYGGFGHYSSVTVPLGGGDTGPEQKVIDPVNIYNNRSGGIIRTETARRNDPTKPVILEDRPPNVPHHMYADKDGNVYKQDPDGAVYQRENSDWQQTDATPSNK